MSPRKNVTYSSRPTYAARSAHAKGDKLFRTYDTSAIQTKRSPVSAILAILILIAAVIGIVVWVSTLVQSCSSSTQLEPGQEVQIVVENGEDVKSVAKKLTDVGLIGNQNEFIERIVQTEGENSLQPGTYVLYGGQSIDEIILTLQTPVDAALFTVPEGATLHQVAQIISQATHNRITVDDFVKAASDASCYADTYSFLEGAGDHSLEGYLFPKSYPYDESSTAESLIRLMLNQYAEETKDLDWSFAEQRGLSQYEVLTLASIVEKESDADHRSEVASVFYNRLSAGMRLQSDATVAYIVGHDPTREDIQTESDFNTYYVDGLPPSPINSPGIECLQAACQPADTNYYYFYFEEDDQGNLKYTFSETYEEHQATYE